MILERVIGNMAACHSEQLSQNIRRGQRTSAAKAHSTGRTRCIAADAPSFPAEAIKLNTHLAQAHLNLFSALPVFNFFTARARLSVELHYMD